MNTIQKDLDWNTLPGADRTESAHVEILSNEVTQITNHTPSANDDFLDELNISEEDWESVSSGGFLVY